MNSLYKVVKVSCQSLPPAVCFLLRKRALECFLIEALNQLNQTSYPQKIKDHKVPPFQGAFPWLKVLVQPVVASFYTYCYVSVHKACCVSFSSLPVCGSSCVRRHSRPEFSVKMRTMRLKESLHLKTAADSAVPDLRPLNSESLQ